MSKSYSETFNAVAQPNKIVSMDELKQKYAEIISKELTFTEKIRRQLMKPKSAFIGAVMGVKIVTDRTVRAMFEDENEDGTVGIYKNPINGEKFMSVGYAKAFTKYAELRDPKEANSPFSIKLAEIYANAFNACKDRTEEVRSNRTIKPTM